MSNVDLASYGLTEEDIRNTAKRMAGMFAPQELQRFKGPDVLKLSDLKIRTKEKGLIRFDPMNIQSMYLTELFGGESWREDPTGLRGLREIILKGRQFGLSTLLMALYFMDTIQTPYTNTVIIAHDAPTTERMFQTVHRFYRHLPADKKPITKYENKRELYWPDIDSSFYVGQAGSVNFGAGMTINNAHCSEVPRWKNAAELIDSLMESVPAYGNLSIESTAKGVGNYFEREYHRAEEGDSIFTPRFFAWPDHEEYRVNVKKYQEDRIALPPTVKKYIAEGPTPEELKLQKHFNLDDGQVMWMRWKKATSKEKFAENYPFTPEEAFLNTGASYFDLELLADINRALKSSEFNPVSQEELRKRIPVYFRLLHKYLEHLELWEWPRNDRFYVMGADPAEGINDEGDHDYDSGDVQDSFSGAQVASFHARIDTHEFGLLLAELGFWYNTALLGVERNNHGHAVLNAIIHHAEYPLMDETMEGGLYLHQEQDRKTNTLSNKPGFPTFRPQKNMGLDFLKTDLDNGHVLLRSRRTVAELMRFVKLPGGRAEGSDGSHDDKVLSMMISNTMRHLRPLAMGNYQAGGRERSEIVTGQDSPITVSGGITRDYRSH